MFKRLQKDLGVRPTNSHGSRAKSESNFMIPYDLGKDL